jgi:hypothetical protein
VSEIDFYRAEHDPFSSEVLICDGYKMAAGTCSAPDAPGFGLAINEAAFRELKVQLDLDSSAASTTN